MIQPLALAGTGVGVILNQIFPQWLTLALLLAIMLYTVYKSGTKGVQLWKDETKPASPKAVTPNEEQNPTNPPTVPPKPKNTVANGLDEDEQNIELDDGIVDGTSFHAQSGLNSSFANLDDEGLFPDKPLPALQQLLDAEARTPWKIIAILFGILIGVTLHSIFVGTGSRPSLLGVVRCSGAYWALFLLAFPALGLIAFFVSRFLMKTHAKRERLSYPFAKGDIQWTPRKTGFIALISIFAGVLASLLGVGGGMIIGPVLVRDVREGSEPHWLSQLFVMASPPPPPPPPLPSFSSNFKSLPMFRLPHHPL